MTPGPESLYLDLMKKTLTFTLWPEPPVPIERYNYLRSSFTKLVVSSISRVLNIAGLGLVQHVPISWEEREEGKFWPGLADTMIGIKRLDNIQYCVETVLKENIEGDFIETGVWRGGACIFMRAILAAYGVENRKVYVADSFQGLPKPDSARYPVDKNDKHHIHDVLAVSQDEVEANFRKYGLLDDQVVFLKGWFKDTLPFAPMEKLAVLRLDGDMYGSTMEALTCLYPKLSKGGFCIIDDYALRRCRKAVEDFRSDNHITSEIKTIDWMGVYWVKD